MNAPLAIAVVGHTNTGKTSLLRTLTRDRGFGEVSARPSTTRTVAGARLSMQGEPVLDLFDTPGLEDPIVLLELLDDIALSEQLRRDGPACIEHFLTLPAAGQRFQQEAQVLRQLRDSAAALYVIDARDPVLAKHRDELQLLAMCAVPILPVLNFVADPASSEAPWRSALARAGLHAVVRFDTVAPERGAERQLYQTLATLLPAQQQRLQDFAQAREREAEARRRAGLRCIAGLLIEAAADSQTVDRRDAAGEALARETLAARLRTCEQDCVDRLLELYQFAADDIESSQLPLVAGRWGLDLFAPEALKQMGVRLGGGALAGAMAGAGVDALVGGITLGAAAATGALLGGGLQSLRHYGRRWLARLRGGDELRIDDALLQLLAQRADYLLRALEARGHAAVQPIAAPSAGGSQWRVHASKVLRTARAHPEWRDRNHPQRLAAEIELLHDCGADAAAKV